MPAVLKIDPQRRIALSTFHGYVTGADVLRHRSVILADPYFEPSFADVVDLSGISFADVDESVLKTLAGAGSVFAPETPHVIIAPGDLPHEIALKYRDLAQHSRPNLHVVRSLAEARELLHKLGYVL